MKRTGLFLMTAALVFTATVAWATPTTTILHHFHGASDGAIPEGNLVAGPDGSLYGTTYRGGAADQGTVFQLKPPAPGKTVWTLKVLHTFTGGADGASPLGGVSINGDGELFGTTTAGGAPGTGVVFRLTPPAPGKTAWTRSILHRFVDANGGSAPSGGLVVTSRDVLYGSTGYGGAKGGGVVFSLTPPAPGKTAWTYRVLASLAGNKEGFGPGTLVRGSDGRLFGTTASAAAGKYGAVFVVTPPAPGKTAWTTAVLHAFTGAPDGSTPMGEPRLGPGGELFGTTEYGGNAAGAGVVYRLTPPAPGKTAWTETILHRFTVTATGTNPYAGVRLTPTGALIGVTDDLRGGSGTVFRLDPPAAGHTAWTKTILHRFTGIPDGAAPYGTPLLRGGLVYGTTGYGGTAGKGTVWRITP